MCPTCLHSEKRRADDCTIQNFCTEENMFLFRGGNCHKAKQKQCTLCVLESGNDELCEPCMNSVDKKHFRLKVVE